MHDRGLRTLLTVVVGLNIVVLGGGRTTAQAPRDSEWSAPACVSGINSTATDFGAAESKDGLTLYFTSTRPGGLGSEDIWVSYRSSVDAPWGPPIDLGAPINSVDGERVPALSRDGHWMYFARFTTTIADIWSSYRLHVHEDFGPFGWQEPVLLEPISTVDNEVAPAFFQNSNTGAAYLFFASNRPGGLGGNDLYVSQQLPDGTFGLPENLTVLNSAVEDAKPTISHDGLEIIFHSPRAGSAGLSDLWAATRDDPDAAWPAPTNLMSLNTAFVDSQPSLSADDRTLYFTSNRPRCVGGNDIWMSQRGRRH